MEDVLAALVGRAALAEGGQQTQGLDTASKHTIPSKNISRRKSLFNLASDFFKSNRPENVEFETDEHEQYQRSRGQWNPLASLRGLRDGRKRAADSSILRGTSLSPQRNNDSGDSTDIRSKRKKTDLVGTDEFCTPKTMRRKSLQDLLGSMGIKLSIAKRLVYSEDMMQPLETSMNGPLAAFLGASREPHDIPPLVLPEPALSFAGEPNTLSDSPRPDGRESIPNEVVDPQDNPTSYRECEELSSNHRSPEKGGCFGTSIETSHIPIVIETTDILKEICISEQLEHMSTHLLSEELSLGAPAINSQDINPQGTQYIKLTDKSDPPQCNDDDDLENKICSQNRNLDRLFPDRMLRRQSKYKSLWDATQPESWDLLPSDVRNHAVISAAKVSKNSHLTDIQTGSSVDSSETDTDNLCDNSWVESEMEVRNSIDRGREMMKLRVLSPHLHSKIIFQTYQPKMSSDSTEESTSRILARNKARPESYHFGNSTSLIIDKATVPDVSSKAIPNKKPAISLDNGERFRPRRTNSRLVSVEPVHIVYPANEFCEAQTKTYASKSSAFGDLYQNHSGYSDYCLFDRSIRTYYPQVLSYSIPESPQNNENLEVVWLPLEMFPADPLRGQTDKGDDKTTSSNERISETNRPSSEFSVPEADQNLILVSAVLNRVDKTTSSSSHDTDANSNNGAEVGYPKPALDVDMDSESKSIYSGTLITIREVSSSCIENPSLDDPESTNDETNSLYETAVDPVMAKLYLMSQFSSTETLHSAGEEIFNPLHSAQSSISHLERAQTAESSKVKTWFDMERDFLNRFAPGSHLSQDRRGRIAVYEAFKNLKGLAHVSDEEDSDGSDQAYEDEFKIEHIEMAQFKEASKVFDLGHAAAKSSHISESSSQNAWLDSGCAIQDKGKGKDCLVLPHLNDKPSMKVDSLRHCFVDMGTSSHAADSNAFMIEGNGDDVSQDAYILNMGDHRKLRSNEPSETDETPIAMLSGYMFTHYAEQLRQHSKEASQEEGHSDRESACQSDISESSSPRTDVASGIMERKSVQILPMCTLLEIEGEIGYDRSEFRTSPKNKNDDPVIATSIQACGYSSQSELRQLVSESSTSMSSGALRDEFSPRPCPVIQKRLLTPNKRLSTPLAEIFPQSNQMAARAASPSLSEANTETSDNFGQKLQSYRCIEEDEKENDFWWTDSISYG